VTHTISFRRPELIHVLSKMSVPPQADVGAQIRRLRNLGYQIVDVRPPLIIYGPGPGNMTVDGAPHDGTGPNPHPRSSESRLARAAASPPRRALPR
jgi:hypothetical protein